MAEGINKQTLPEQIYRVLREDILYQRIPCGSKLTLQSLRDRFGVSHTPIREALTRLIEDHLVSYYSNVGVSVISLDDRDIKEIFELSYELDCIAIKRIFAEGQEETLVAELAENIKICHEHLENRRIDEWSTASDGFHEAFYPMDGNSRLNGEGVKLRTQIMLIYHLYKLEQVNYLRIQGYHDIIYQALRDGDTEAALSALKLHLMEDMEGALLSYSNETNNKARN